MNPYKIIFSLSILWIGLFFWQFDFQEIKTLKNISEADSNIHKEQGSVLDSGAQLYLTRCGICHNGNVAEAPRIESMKLQSTQAIIQSLENGVMKMQGAGLTRRQKELVANYISSIDKGMNPEGVQEGICAEQSIQKTPVFIANWGMDERNSRYINAESIEIKPENISQLKIKWVFAFPDATRARAQPTIVGNTLFTASQHGLIYALDTETGCIRWTFQAEDEVRSAIVVGTDGEGNANRLYFGDFKANVYALDLNTRQIIWKKKVDDHAQATITGTLALHQGKVYVPVSSTEVISAYNPNYPCCTFRGSVAALDTENGELHWKTYMTDLATPQGLNSEGAQKYGPSGAPIWSSPTIDTKRGVLYIGTGENYTRPATGTSDAIIALDLQNGKIQWIHQALSEDAWNGSCSNSNPANCPDFHGPDYDFGAPPILVTGAKDYILAGQKSGMVYALDPDNKGAIIWQKQVGRGGIMGGVHWGMATDGKILYVPINDQSVYEEDKHKPSQAGLHSMDITSGEVLWSKLELNRCPPEVSWVCAPGLSAPITLIPGLVFAASLDGMIHVYDAKNGNTLWEYDTNRDFESVNGVKAYGGTIDSSGPIVVGKKLWINSGYAKFGEKAGNVLLCFELDK